MKKEEKSFRKSRNKINKNLSKARKGNQNAKGNRGGYGAPKGNFNALKHGEHLSEDIFFKGLPKILVNSIKNKHSESYIDKLWRSILIQEARIISMQKICTVKNKKDMTKELKKVSKGKISSEEYEIQFAWDKENNNIVALSKAMDTLSKLIERYDKLINQDHSLEQEERRLKIEKLRYEVDLLSLDKTKEGNLEITKMIEGLVDEI